MTSHERIPTILCWVFVGIAACWLIVFGLMLWRW
jgi:hypothetical protein